MDAYVLAPCPHDRHCPMSGDAWCHFSQRLERSLLQRQVKKASMPFEDEKFSYVVLVRGERPELNHEAPMIHTATAATESAPVDTPVDAAAAAAAAHWPRIIHPPIKQGGHVTMDVCQPTGEIQRRVISRAQGEEHGYRRARKASQGDLWPYPFANTNKPPQTYD